MYVTNLTVISKYFIFIKIRSKFTSHEVNFYHFFLSNFVLCSFACQHRPAPKGFHENVLLYLNSNLTAWQVYTPCVCMCVWASVCVGALSGYGINPQTGRRSTMQRWTWCSVSCFFSSTLTIRAAQLVGSTCSGALFTKCPPDPHTPDEKTAWLLRLLQHIDQKNR